MLKRGSLIFVVLAVVLAGLAVGLVLILGMDRFGRSAGAPTLAPVAIVASATSTAVNSPAQDTATEPAPDVGAAAGEPATPQAQPTSTLEDATATQTATPPVAAFIDHVVGPGEDLATIAARYGVSVDAILASNAILDPDLIWPGDVVRIPRSSSGSDGAGGALPTAIASATLPLAVTQPPAGPSATATQSPGDAAASPNWPPSAISGDLPANYPLVKQTGSTALLLHYQPGTAPAHEIDALSETIDRIFARLQASMNGRVPRQVDVYLGGTLFGANPSLQGFTQSYEFRSFVLVNGAFHPGERDYILAHELAHVAATHILGPASSTMIHEGLATYLPQSYLTDGAGYLSIEQICAAAYHTPAFRSATQLSRLAYGESAFGGHIRSFFNYNLSGCFVGYLLETYGMQQLDRVYDSGDYTGVYGLSLSELDAAWQEQLQATPVTVDAERFVAAVEEIADVYETYIAASAGGYHANYQAYLHLNRARLEANRGNLDAAQGELQQYRALMANP